MRYSYTKCVRDVLLSPACSVLSASETATLSAEEMAELTPDELTALESGEPDLPELTSSSSAAVGINQFELPFRCRQRWLGSTRSYHSPANAIDFNHPKGDFGRRVLAAAGGRVTRSGFIKGRSYGRWIEIGHGNGYTTRYAHLSRRAVRLGQRVRKGQVIGRVGNSGGSTGSHLHYELRRYGNAIRPKFHGNAALFWGTRYYRSFNCR